MEESARISRGDCKALETLNASEFDALLIPGGFGAAKNLSDFGFKGVEMKVDENLEKIMRDFHANNKVIGLTCISPILAAKVFGKEGIKITLGGRGENFPYDGALDAATKFGAIVEEMDVKGTCTDWTNDIVTSTGYMQGNAKPHEVYDGVQHFIRRVNSVVQQNLVIDAKKNTEQLEEATTPKNEDILTANFIQMSVNKIWEDYDRSKDGKLCFEDSRDFIKDSFGGHLKLPESEIKALFDKIDTDGDGSINKGEMAVFLLKLTKF